MYETVLHIFYVVLTTTCAKIAFLVVVTLQISIHCSRKGVAADIKLPHLVQQRLLTIFLDNIGALLPVHVCVVYNLSYLAEFTTDCDATSTVRVLTRLYDPELLAHSWILNQVRVIQRLIIGLFEFVESAVVQTILYMIS